MSSHQFQFRSERSVVQRPQPPSVPNRLPRNVPLGISLLHESIVSTDALINALAAQSHARVPLQCALVSTGTLTAQALSDHRARTFGLGAIDPVAVPPNARLIEQLGAETCLKNEVLPWGHLGSAVVILVPDPEIFDRNRAWLETIFGKVIPALAPFEAIETAVLRHCGPRLDHQARHRVPESASCRGWMKIKAPRIIVAVIFAVILSACLFPRITLLSATAWAILTLFLAALLKAAATIAALTRKASVEPPQIIAQLPVVSIMVPLFKEARIARRLLERLQRIDYPNDLLDIHLVVEEDDLVTRTALTKTALPDSIRITVAPKSALKTKPRALNHAVGRCRGSIIAIYDAEDAPAADQLRRVVERFHRRGAEVACLQGILDFSNPETNWLARCFTLEYAAWFRLVLPGMARLGFAIPLGGTTLFFRKVALEAVGGWDAHNVTEDADLGIRLARSGYRTELIDSVTHEEANCRVLPWIRQRSRWIKGYMMTYAVHMRDPRRLWRDIGWWRFLGFQTLFLTTLSQFLLTPLLLSFWIVPLGFSHPVLESLPLAINYTIIGCFLFSEAVLLVVGLVALRLTQHTINPLWVIAQHVYFPLAGIAALKALWEVMTRPFYWDKTAHGLFDGA